MERGERTRRCNDARSCLIKALYGLDKHDESPLMYTIMALVHLSPIPEQLEMMEKVIERSKEYRGIK